MTSPSGPQTTAGRSAAPAATPPGYMGPPGARWPLAFRSVSVHGGRRTMTLEPVRADPLSGLGGDVEPTRDLGRRPPLEEGQWLGQPAQVVVPQRPESLEDGLAG